MENYLQSFDFDCNHTILLLIKNNMWDANPTMNLLVDGGNLKFLLPFIRLSIYHNDCYAGKTIKLRNKTVEKKKIDSIWEKSINHNIAFVTHWCSTDS